MRNKNIRNELLCISIPGIRCLVLPLSQPEPAITRKGLNYICHGQRIDWTFGDVMTSLISLIDDVRFNKKPLMGFERWSRALFVRTTSSGKNAFAGRIRVGFLRSLAGR